MKTAAITFCALGLLLCSGCPPSGGGGKNGASSGKTGGSGSGAAAVQPAAPGGTLTLPLEIAPGDSRLASLDLSTHQLFALSRCIAVPLIRCAPDGTLSAGLASAWEMSADALTWSFTNNTPPDFPDATMPPGTMVGLWIKHLEALLRGPDTPLRAQAADLIAGAAAYRDGRALDISGVKLNVNTLKITLTRPNRVFGMWLSQPGLGVLESAKLPTSSYGPYVLDSIDGDKLLLLPNPRSLVGQPPLDELNFVCLVDRALQVQRFREGLLDAANIPADGLPELQADSTLKNTLISNETAAPLLGIFDLHEFPWGDGQFQSKLGLREAANWDLDREYLATEQNGMLTAWPHILPSAMSRYLDPQHVQQPPFPLAPEIEKSRDGLKRADHEQGGKLPRGMDILYMEDEHLDNIVTSVLAYLEEVSIKMRPFPAKPADLRKRFELDTTEIILTAMYPAYPDPDALFYPALHSSLTGDGGNWSLLKDGAIDAQLAAGQAEADVSSREVIYRKLSAEMEDRALFLFIGYSSPTWLIRPGLAGMALTPYDFDASLPAQDFTKLGWAANK